jgi:protein-arginine kinase activator protein McsA
METPRGCAECRKTNKPLNQYAIHDLLGRQFLLFVCNDCIIPFSDEVKAMSRGEQVTFLTHLGQIIHSSNK